jgi:2-phospho-L-lactate guanylyltransferase
VQATVATFDPAERTGTMLLDDGTQLNIPAAAFTVSGLRLLRPGQRLTVETDGTGQVTRVFLPAVG